MASVEYNESIRGFHGVLGNMIFYEWEGDPFVRKRWKISKPQSEAQKAQRNAFHDAAAAWRLLSGEIKENWKAVGGERRITGYNAFLRVNIPRIKKGEDVMIIPAGATHAWPLREHAQPPVSEGCHKFMESIHDMVERVSCEAHAHAGRSAIPAGMVRRIASHHELRMCDLSVSSPIKI